MDVDGEPKVSLKNTESSPISDIDCKSKLEIEKLVLNWQQWAKTQKLLYKDKVTWSDLALRIT